MKIEFLKSVPESGVYEEFCFNDTGATSWVIFETDEFEKWAGAFGHGEYGITKIVAVDEYALVIVKGAGYLVNRNKRTAERLIDDEYGGISSANATTNPNLLVCSTSIGYTVIRNGRIVASERPDWIDGLEFLSQEGILLKGQIYQVGQHDYWNGVSLNLDTLHFQINNSIKIDYWGLMAKKDERKAKSGILNSIKRVLGMKKSA